MVPPDGPGETSRVEDDLVVRPIDGLVELRACEDLQMEVWGYTEREVVPKNELLAAVRSGGSLLGAFHRGPAEGEPGGIAERLVGFSYGMAGLDAEGPYLSSRLVAVRSGVRSQGLGERLKREQRKHALSLGYARMRWTQDPLQAANARLNFRKLGATARRYTRDYYGGTSSPLHGSLPTDRLEVEWDLASPGVARRLGEAAGVDPLAVPARPEPRPLLEALPAAVTDPTAPPEPGEVRSLPGDAERLLVAVPPSLADCLARDPELARRWRLATRAAFEAAFAAGFAVTDFVSTKPDPAAGLRGDARYVLSRPG